MTRTVDELAGRVIRRYGERGLRIATAESCTGGLIAGALTEVAGASDVIDRGFITYSNTAKTEMLGVPSATIAERGAVSRDVARAMAEGAVAHSDADRAVAVTGVAGPGGGSAEKPVGLVHFAVARRDGATADDVRVFEGRTRAGVRADTVKHALELLLASLD